MKKIIVAIACLALVIIAVQPLYTMHSIKSALETNDSDKLDKFVEFNQLRDSIKVQVDAVVDQQMQKHLGTDSSNPLAMAGAMLASKLAKQSVDNMVTPEGITKLLEGKVGAPVKQKTPSAEPSKEEGGQSGQSKNKQEKKSLFEQADFSFESSSRIRISLPSDNLKDPVDLLLTRKGIRWYLSEIYLVDVSQ